MKIGDYGTALRESDGDLKFFKLAVKITEIDGGKVTALVLAYPRYLTVFHKKYFIPIGGNKGFNRINEIIKDFENIWGEVKLNPKIDDTFYYWEV